MDASGSAPVDFGRYRLLKTLGKGGMGTVYLAEDLQQQRTVAIKIPQFALQQHEESNALKRFQREASIASKIDHLNLCPVYDFGEHQGIHYLCMPYIEGKTLFESLADTAHWSTQQIVELFSQLASGLSCLHQNNIVHRDLKSENIILQTDGQPVIMDFGLAFAYDHPSQRFTNPGTSIGTPSYMSPEQIQGLREIDHRTDIYSLGVILYEVLAGELPFQGPPLAVFGQIIHAAPPLPSTLRDNVDPQLERICTQAMAKTPEERFPSMRHFLDVLSHVKSPSLISPSVPVDPPIEWQLPETECPQCKKKLLVPLELQDTQIMCPECSTEFSSSGTQIPDKQQSEITQLTRKKTRKPQYFSVLAGVLLLSLIGYYLVRNSNENENVNPSPTGKAPPNEREKRVLRWSLTFKTLNGKDYARQLHGLGAILAIPKAGTKQYVVFRDLTKSPTQGKVEDVSTIQRIYWIDERPTSVKSLSAALGWKPTPKLFVAFFPKTLEEKMLRLELAYAKSKYKRTIEEKEIDSTKFRVLRLSNGKYDVKVSSVELLPSSP